MPSKTIAQGNIIFQGGQPVDSLAVISRGSVRAAYPGGEFFLEKGDIIGLCELCFDSHFITYTAEEESALSYYPYNPEEAEAFFDKYPDFGGLFASSCLRQLKNIFDQYELLKFDCDNFYRFLMENYTEYKKFCERYQMTARALPGIETVEPLVLEEDVAGWVGQYYEALYTIMNSHGAKMVKEPGFLKGLLFKASQDIHEVISVCRSMYDYKSDISYLLLNENGLDFFDLYTAMYIRMGTDAQDSTAVSSAISRIMIELESQDSTDRSLYDQRVKEYKESLNRMEEFGDEPAETVKVSGSLEELKDSLNQILNYAECVDDVTIPFRQAVNEYKKLIDKNSTDDSVRKLRLTITKLFYEIYTAAFQVSLLDKNMPKVMKMFFNFGYVDEELAGMENAAYLYSIVDSIPSDPALHVYTIYEWLRAVYDGKKEPSRNEFDSDYTDYVHEMKVTGKIDGETEARLVRDRAQRVMFEIQNMFPLVNKMTFGRVSTFCPVFSEHNILKPLDSMLVSAAGLVSALRVIRELDFSAYYRETVFSKPEIGLNREYIHVEVTPDIILLPNIGIRGVMWQEIEGKRRTTPSRMMVSLFYMEDLQHAMTRLTAEFRWEMCRRIQGARWNDVSERSLTSEYFDYAQFYRKNHDLSSDAKDKIRAAMQKAKNSYKEMFFSDYISYILYEGQGSPRLNKVARNILFTYCPFSRETRDKLRSNPLYRDLMDRYDIRSASRIHHLNNICQKLSNSRTAIPPEIDRETAFAQM